MDFTNFFLHLLRQVVELKSDGLWDAHGVGLQIDLHFLYVCVEANRIDPLDVLHDLLLVDHQISEVAGLRRTALGGLDVIGVSSEI